LLRMDLRPTKIFESEVIGIIWRDRRTEASTVLRLSALQLSQE
jgi:hypothetical protein